MKYVFENYSPFMCGEKELQSCWIMPTIYVETLYYGSNLFEMIRS